MSGARTSRPDDEDRLARAAWSRLVEPGDTVAGALLSALGPGDALAWVRTEASGSASSPSTGATRTVGAPTSRERLARSVTRWAVRLDGLDPDRDVDHLRRLGGDLVVPGDPGWPPGLDDLGAAAPPCLWVRGRTDLGALLRGAVAVIGSRACTAYGEHVAGGIAAGIADDGRTVVSGGAYGIDAVAHRAALAVGGPTVAFGAGGVDRPYPAGNARLLAAVVDEGGAVVSEVPPGATPTRSRFLQRNRLIAAAGAATVVVEAAWRSGALSTARHAADLLRPVGAVPGPVTSAASAGCHRLLRDGAAVCVTDAAEALELVRAPGPTSGEATADAEAARPADGLTEVQARVLDALPVRRAATEEALCRTAGLGVGEVRAALGVLGLRDLAVQGADGWRTGRAAGQRAKPDMSVT